MASSKDNVGSYRFDDPDPYIVFDGPVYDTTPRNLIPLIDTLRRESEWQALGLIAKKDRNGNYKPIIKKGLYFGFQRKLRLDAVDMAAIASGKKLTRHASSVLSLLRQGCSYDDFVPLPQDVVAYCECQRASDHREYEAALAHIRKAFAAKPEDVTYASAYFEVKLKLGDKSAIEEELRFFRGDIDCLIHSGRVYEWLKYLSFMKDYVSLDSTVKQIDQQLDELIGGQARNRRYSSQSVEFYAHEKEQFLKKTTQLRKRIETALAKQRGT
jgi:hypothetical protein